MGGEVGVHSVFVMRLLSKLIFTTRAILPTFDARAVVGVSWLLGEVVCIASRRSQVTPFCLRTARPSHTRPVQQSNFLHSLHRLHRLPPWSSQTRPPPCGSAASRSSFATARRTATALCRRRWACWGVGPVASGEFSDHPRRGLPIFSHVLTLVCYPF